MTLERASEIVMATRKSDREAAMDLFAHFVEHFNLGGERITTFAVLCEYPIAFDIRFEADAE